MDGSDDVFESFDVNEVYIVLCVVYDVLCLRIYWMKSLRWRTARLRVRWVLV